MGEKILKYPVIYAFINLVLCIVIILALGKVYIDYKVSKEKQAEQEQLNRIELSQDNILRILKNQENEREE